MHDARSPARLLAAVMFVLPFAVAAPRAAAQSIDATTYPFAATTGVALEDMTSGTTQIVAPGSDDNASSLRDIGFDFWFAGTRATQFSVSANGLLRLGPVPATTSFSNSIASTTSAPKIVAYWDDLCVGTNGRVHYKVVGTAPARRLVVEWQNMQISRGTGCAGPGNGTFQVWLTESTGVVQLVYGALPAPNIASDGGYSVGIQSGAANNFASVTTATGSVSYVTPNNTQGNAIAAGTSYTFTPPRPGSPSGLAFSGVTSSSMTLSWSDNSSDESGFAIYRSDDGGATYTFAAQADANATSSTQTGLAANTTYQWRVYAVGGGALSANAASGSRATLPPQNIASATSGPWSSPSTWQGGDLPGPEDTATIATGTTVTLDLTTAVRTLTVSGALVYEATTPRTLAVAASVTILPGGRLASAATGNTTAHVLDVAGNLRNQGTLDFSTNGDTAGATIAFTGDANARFDGTGATTDVRAITMAKADIAATLELAPTNFTVRGATTDTDGFLTLTGGTFRLGGSFAGTNRVFPIATWVIPANAGFWLDNPNYTVVGQAGGTTTANNGLLRIAQGTFNIGVDGADGMGGGDGAQFVIEGGTLRSAGRIDPQGAVSWNQSGGTVTVGAVGNTRGDFGTFELRSTAATFAMTGGTLELVQPSTATPKFDYRVLATTFTASGGQLVIGAAPAPAGRSYVVTGRLPATTINATMTATMNGTVEMRGSTVTNNGSITAAGAMPRFDFAGSVPMTYQGTGTFGTSATPFVTVSANSPERVTLNAPIVTSRVNLIQGGFDNSDRITLGNGGTSQTTVFVGSADPTKPGGSFDVSPVHNQGTGGQVLIYTVESIARTTSVEINPTRTLAVLTLTRSTDVVVDGGDITVTGAGPSLSLTGGARLVTGPHTLILANPAATPTATTSWVDGDFRKTFASGGVKVFEVGTANGTSPVAVNAFSGPFPLDVTVRATQGPVPGISPPDRALQRRWTVSTSSPTTALLTFNYRDPLDIPAGATEASFRLYRRDGSTLVDLGGTVNTTANNIAASVSTFGEFTAAEPGATISFAPTIAASAIARRAGDAVAPATIATVSDVDDPVDNLVVTVNGGTTATVNGVLVISPVVGADGEVTANVVAACGASDAAFTLRVTDDDGRFAEATLDVAVQPNLPPELAYPAATSVPFGQGIDIAPTTGPSDTGAVFGVFFADLGTFTGDAAVGLDGLVSVTRAEPAGTHTIVIRAVDNCSAQTEASFQLEVPGTDLAIAKTSNLSQVASGLVQYTLVASNAGPYAVGGAVVADELPAEILAATWTCTGLGGASCAASGSGDIAEAVNLPVGTSVVFSIVANVATNPLPGFFANTATIAATAAVPDVDASNDSATVTDAVVLLRDGFEDGGGGGVVAQAIASGLGGQLQLDTNEVTRHAVGPSPQDVALYAIGDELVLVSARRVGGAAQVRVLQRDGAGDWHPGPWAAVVPQQSLSLLWSRDGAGMLRTGVRVE